jgi:hypothetical protein
MATDDEIRASPAFPRLVHALQINSRIFWAGLPLFVAASIYGISQRVAWAQITALLLAVGNVCAQLYGIRQARQSASEISSSRVVQARAQNLADEAAKPRLLRWLRRA